MRAGLRSLGSLLAMYSLIDVVRVTGLILRC